MTRAPALDTPLETSLFDYHLPPELIAQEPAEPRDTARLLAVGRTGGTPSHHVFRELPDLLREGDLLLMNRSRVLPGRLAGHPPGSTANVELLLLRHLGPGRWQVLGRPGRRLRPGASVELGNGDLVAQVLEVLPGGDRVIALAGPSDPDAALARIGRPPLPPYIRDWQGDPERYQTVYADRLGSAAAPTAGLHFTPDLLDRLGRRGIERAFVTLHVGVDTFRPIRSAVVGHHEMHAERVDVPGATLEAVEAARLRGSRVVVVGTTTVRALESVPLDWQGGDWGGWTRLFIQPGHRFRRLDGLITNFHLPRSTLLVLVSALMGRERLLAAYKAAISAGYRFYSFGDAMLILDPF